MEQVMLGATSVDEDNNSINNSTVSNKMSEDNLVEVPIEMYDTSQARSRCDRNLTTDSSTCKIISRMALNDNKAGMEGLDRERINKIIHDASKGSKFYENAKKKEDILNMKIQEQQALIESVSDSQLQFGIFQADQLMRELEEKRDLSRTIVHVDMDAFYAAVEMRDDPSLRNKPIAVGSMSMLSTSNYIARRFGIRAAMPGFIGRKLCPELVIIQPNFEKYISVSETVREILTLYDPNFLSVSLDEAYLDFTEHLHTRLNSPTSSRTFLLRTNSSCNPSLCLCDLNLVLRPIIPLEGDVSHNQSDDKTKISPHVDNEHMKICSQCKKQFPSFIMKVYGVSVEEAVLEMRNRIEQRTQLTASAGIAPNTMLAKVCSDRNKPNGQFRVEPTKQQVEHFVSGLPVRKISGIGNVTEKLLEALGVVTCHDLYEKRGLLYHAFSAISFHHFISIAMGIGSSTLERDSERKSISTEQTFGDLVQPKELFDKCQELSHILAKDLRKEKLLGKTLTLKMKTVNFEVKTRTISLSRYSNDINVIFKAAKQLLEAEILLMQPDCLRLRLMGVKMSKLVSQNECSASVSNYFDKHCKNNSARKGFSADIVSTKTTKQDKYPNMLVNSESKDIPATHMNLLTYESPMTNSCNSFPQDEDDVECNFLQTYLETDTNSEVSNVTFNSTGSTHSKVGHHKRNEKQETIVNFLYNKDCQLREENYSRRHSHLIIGQSSNTSDILSRHNVNEASTFKTNIPCVNSSSKYTSSSSNATSSNVTQSPSVTDGHHHASKMMQKLLPINAVLTTSTDTHQPVGMIHCPVCGQQKYQWPLDQLNMHIDLCLSRSTVRDILIDQQHQNSSVSKKRSRQDDETKHVHKQNKSQHTLLSFFKQ